MGVCGEYKNPVGGPQPLVLTKHPVIVPVMKRVPAQQPHGVSPYLKSACVAGATLDYERVRHEQLLCDKNAAYGKHLAEIWRRGEGFILVEDDIAPWPGAIKELDDCPEPWCGFQYLWCGSQISGTIGCMKVGAQLTQDHPDVWKNWIGKPWTFLDGSIFQTIKLITESYYFHVHGPPVAHARGLR